MDDAQVTTNKSLTEMFPMADDNIDNKEYEPEAEASNLETSSDDEPPFDRNAHKLRHKQKKWMANNKKKTGMDIKIKNLGCRKSPI